MQEKLVEEFFSPLSGSYCLFHLFIFCNLPYVCITSLLGILFSQCFGMIYMLWDDLFFLIFLINRNVLASF